MGVKCLECARILPEMRENLLSRYANKMLNNGVLGRIGIYSLVSGLSIMEMMEEHEGEELKYHIQNYAIQLIASYRNENLR